MGNFTMKPALTQTDVAHGLSERPCKNGFRGACEKLPDWKATAYSPREMAEHGVSLNDIIWAFLRPEVLGRDAFIEATCRIAERALRVFETVHPDYNRPREAINAAREYRDGKISKEEVLQAARATWPAMYAAEAAASVKNAANAALVAVSTAREAMRVVHLTGVTILVATEQRAQIEIIETVIEEYNG
jgi:hypothetical protein